jgi:hypothetical protein
MYIDANVNAARKAGARIFGPMVSSARSHYSRVVEIIKTSEHCLEARLLRLHVIAARKHLPIKNVLVVLFWVDVPHCKARLSHHERSACLLWQLVDIADNKRLHIDSCFWLI